MWEGGGGLCGPRFWEGGRRSNVPSQRPGGGAAFTQSPDFAGRGEHASVDCSLFDRDPIRPHYYYISMHLIY